MMWKPFKKDDLELCLKQPGDFFMVRQIGIHQVKGVKFIPVIVQLIDGALYSSTDELEPLVFGLYEPIDNPFDANLEWMALPD